jgi:hypothetical protein
MPLFLVDTENKLYKIKFNKKWREGFEVVATMRPYIAFKVIISNQK